MNVEDLDRLSFEQGPTDNRPATWLNPKASEIFNVSLMFAREAKTCGKNKIVLFGPPNMSPIGIAQPRRQFDEHLKYYLQIKC